MDVTTILSKQTISRRIINNEEAQQMAHMVGYLLGVNGRGSLHTTVSLVQEPE